MLSGFTEGAIRIDNPLMLDPSTLCVVETRQRDIVIAEFAPSPPSIKSWKYKMLVKSSKRTQ